MRASACASPGKAEGGTGRPPRKNKKNRREGGGARERPTATKPPANTTRDCQTPHPEGTVGRTPKGAQRDHPAKTGNTKPGTAAHRKKGHPQRTDTRHAKKKRTCNPPRKRGDGGTGTTRPGTGTSRKKKKKQNAPRQPDQEGRATAETRAQHPRPHSTPRPGKAGNKRGAPTNTQPCTAPPTRRCRRPRGTGARAHTHPNTPQGEAGRSRNPNPSTHARTAHRKRWGAGGPRTQPDTSHKQAETQTPQTPADKRGTTPQTVPKHTRPRPQPGPAGLPKPTPNRNQDPNTNATQQ